MHQNNVESVATVPRSVCVWVGGWLGGGMGKDTLNPPKSLKSNRIEYFKPRVLAKKNPWITPVA